MLVNVITYSAPPQSAYETLFLITTDQFYEEALASQAVQVAVGADQEEGVRGGGGGRAQGVGEGQAG